MRANDNPRPTTERIPSAFEVANLQLAETMPAHELNRKPHAEVVIGIACDADAMRRAEGYRGDTHWMSHAYASPHQLVLRGHIPRHRRGDSFGIASDRLQDIYHATRGQYPSTPRKAQEPATERERRANTPTPSALAREIAFDILHDHRAYPDNAASLKGTAELVQRVLDNYPNTPTRSCEGDNECSHR